MIIPTSCFTEKEGIYVNLEGRPQISRQVKVPISGVRNCWSFFNSLSRHLNMSTDYENLNDVRSVMFKKFPHLSNISLVPQNNIAKLKKHIRSFLKILLTQVLKTFI